MMKHIKVWCEYDISGEFGGNNNEDCLTVSENDKGDINKLVLNYVKEMGGFESEEDLDGLWGWEFITLTELTGDK